MQTNMDWDTLSLTNNTQVCQLVNRTIDALNFSVFGVIHQQHSKFTQTLLFKLYMQSIFYGFIKNTFFLNFNEFHSIFE